MDEDSPKSLDTRLRSSATHFQLFRNHGKTLLLKKFQSLPRKPATPYMLLNLTYTKDEAPEPAGWTEWAIAWGKWGLNDEDPEWSSEISKAAEGK